MSAAAALPETPFESQDESLLVSRLAAFDAEAWRTVFDRYFASVFRLAYARTQHPAAAEDIAAETFAEAAAGIRRYRYRGVPFRAWLYRIARNLVSDHLKGERQRRRVPLGETGAEAETAPAFEMRADLLAALDELTEDQKTVVILRLVDGYSLAEVAQIMGRSTGAIKQLQYRGVAVLQRLMSEERTGGGQRP